MNEQNKLIVQKVQMPTRSASYGPRSSKYPVDDLIAAGEGAAFAIELKDEDTGIFYEGQELKDKASQKQSQMSGLAKIRGAKLVTRLIEKQEDNPFEGFTAPLLGVWYAGKATPKAPKASATDAAPELPVEGSDVAPELPVDGE